MINFASEHLGETIYFGKLFVCAALTPLFLPHSTLPQTGSARVRLRVAVILRSLGRSALLRRHALFVSFGAGDVFFAVTQISLLRLHRIVALRVRTVIFRPSLANSVCVRVPPLARVLLDPFRVLVTPATLRFREHSARTTFVLRLPAKHALARGRVPDRVAEPARAPLVFGQAQFKCEFSWLVHSFYRIRDAPPVVNCESEKNVEARGRHFPGTEKPKVGPVCAARPPNRREHIAWTRRGYLDEPDRAGHLPIQAPRG